MYDVWLLDNVIQRILFSCYKRVNKGKPRSPPVDPQAFIQPWQKFCSTQGFIWNAVRRSIQDSKTDLSRKWWSFTQIADANEVWKIFLWSVVQGLNSDVIITFLSLTQSVTFINLFIQLSLFPPKLHSYSKYHTATISPRNPNKWVLYSFYVKGEIKIM